MMHNYENAGSHILSWFFFISCVVICNFFILNLTVGQIMIKYDNEQEAMEKVNEANNEYDVFSKELWEFGKEVLYKSFEIE